MTGYSNDFHKWVRKPETKARLALAKQNGWAQFTKKVPNADKDQFLCKQMLMKNYK